jgi:hypothetical protein
MAKYILKVRTQYENLSVLQPFFTYAAEKRVETFKTRSPGNSRSEYC